MDRAGRGVCHQFSTKILSSHWWALVSWAGDSGGGAGEEHGAKWNGGGGEQWIQNRCQEMLFSIRNCSACGMGPGSTADAVTLDSLQELSDVGEVKKNRELIRGEFLWPVGDTALCSPSSSVAKCVLNYPLIFHSSSRKKMVRACDLLL